MNPYRIEEHDTLLSVLVELRAASNCLIMGPLGIPVRSWFLERIRHIDLKLFEELHDKAGVKPYTVSTLLDDEGMPLGPGKILEPGDSCWVRISSCAGFLSSFIQENFVKEIQSKPKPISIFQMGFLAYDCAIRPNKHPLANKTTYQKIAQWENLAAPKKQYQLRFLSPTAFRSNGLDLPLPIPELVYNSYFEKWNAFCPENMKISKSWWDFIKTYIKVSRITNIHTMEWAIPGEDRYQIIPGFKGKVTFTLSKKHKLDQESDFWRNALSILQALSDYSFYCGTGEHATVGMGQTKLIDGGK